MKLLINRTILPVLVILCIMVGAVGCGGGGGGHTSSAALVDATLFTPNYISALDNLLHWNHLPMRVSFQYPSNLTQLGWTKDMMTSAAAEWNQYGRQALVTVVPYGDPADVVVTFVSRSSFTGTSNATGITHVTYYQNTLQLNSASIQVCEDDPYRGYLSANDAQFTITHELGHALGIQGHSDSSDDLMCQVFHGGKTYPITERDFNTIMSAYPSYFLSSIQTLKAAPKQLEQGELRGFSIE